MDKPLSDLEFEILERLYTAPLRRLSWDAMYAPIGLRVHDYRSALNVLAIRKLIELDGKVFVLSDIGATKYLHEINARARSAQEESRQLEREKHADELFRRENKREWIGIIASNVIALAALAVAIISLCQ